MVYKDDIQEILNRRQLSSSGDWKAFGERLSGCEIPDFDVNRYQDEYMQADEELKNKTFLGKFVIAALEQKSMVTNRIFTSGSLLAGISEDFRKNGFRGIRDYWKIIAERSDEGLK